MFNFDLESMVDEESLRKMRRSSVVACINHQSLNTLSHHTPLGIYTLSPYEIFVLSLNVGQIVIFYTYFHVSFHLECVERGWFLVLSLSCAQTRRQKCTKGNSLQINDYIAIKEMHIYILMYTLYQLQEPSKKLCKDIDECLLQYQGLLKVLRSILYISFTYQYTLGFFCEK